MSHPYDPNAPSDPTGSPAVHRTDSAADDHRYGPRSDGPRYEGAPRTTAQTEGTPATRPDPASADQPRQALDHQAAPDAPPDHRTETSPRDDEDEAPHVDLLTQEKAAFGGLKVGSAFFGWLTAIGTVAILSAVLAVVASGLDLDANSSTSDLTGVGLGAAISLLLVLFVGYLAGGYVAGRMARFQGAKQGIAVWLWGLVIAVALSVVAAIVGDQSTVTVRANLPQIPFTSDGFTWQAIVGLIVVLVVTLLGAVLGGLLGMRFHRRVDRFAAKVRPLA